MADTAKKSREQRKAEKELQEAREHGTVEPEKDEFGRDINPHIPSYMKDAPWYVDTGRPTLSHQRPQHEEEKSSINEKWYTRGKKAPVAATKFRKGACTNCGAMTHKAQDCCERPRKRGAKYNPKNIKPDEVISEVTVDSSDYDGTRDRWNGYDTSNHEKIMKKFQKIDEIRAKKRDEEKEKTTEGENETRDEDGFLVDESEDQVGQRRDAKTRTTIRHLRIREDTAKYLLNLDENSAFYDPKSRAMRENPLPHADKDDATFTGENFVRSTGDVKNFNNLQSFAWEDRNQTNPAINLIGAPSSTEKTFKTTKKTTEETSTTNKKNIMAIYGGEEHMSAPKELIYAGSTQYVEYAKDGSILKGSEKTTVKSKYDEDIFVNNHTTVWGSFWEDGCWGYACCQQMLKNSYCIGKQKGEVPLIQSTSNIVKENEKKRSLSESSSKPDKKSKKQKIN